MSTTYIDKGCMYVNLFFGRFSEGSDFEEQLSEKMDKKILSAEAGHWPLRRKEGLQLSMPVSVR